MNIRAKLERKGKIAFTLFRQMPHDPKIEVGKKVKWGSGSMWTVLEIIPEVQS
jgi:hypothetical protein